MDRLQGMQLFIRVVETGSFSKASADVGVTQPTATKHVAALEQRLGARLFHRSTRGVTPTEIGLLYYEKCRLIARELITSLRGWSPERPSRGGRAKPGRGSRRTGKSPRQ